MACRAEEPLLQKPAVVEQGTGRNTWCSRKHRYCAIASLALVGLVMLSERFPQKPHEKPFGMEMLSGWGDPSCYTFTGGTCAVQDCLPYEFSPGAFS